MMEWGYDSDRGRAALRRMNLLHNRFEISNEDLLYVLSTFVFEPIRWNSRYGWRAMTEAERLALFHFWREVGLRMNIRQIPERYDDFEQYNFEYERAHFQLADTNAKVGGATRDMFVGWFPRWSHWLVRPAIYALMDEPILNAFGFPKPSSAMRHVVETSLRVRSRLLRLLPPRRRPKLRTSLTHRTYPTGYSIDRLGPEAAA
jgi:hypothetical protein